MIDLSVILPVHNEAQGIGKTLDAIERTLRADTLSYEIICVENGSTDTSYHVLSARKKTDAHLQCIQSSTGWGNAIRAGIQKANGKYTCFMVSDGQIEPKWIVKLLKVGSRPPARLAEAPAKRVGEAGKLEVGSVALVKIWRTNRENPTRLINSRLYNFFARLLFGIDSKDVNATPKIIDTKLLQSIPLTAKNIALDLELLIELNKRSFSWIEIPAPSKIRNSGSSTTKLATVWEMVKWMIMRMLNLPAGRQVPNTKLPI